jgi:hypothetical protein
MLLELERKGHFWTDTNQGYYPNIYSSVVLAVSVVNPNIYRGNLTNVEKKRDNS